MTVPLALYAAATGLLEPLAPAVLARRAARGKEDPARLGERLGRASRRRPDGPLAWLHGVSVGEATSLLPVIGALRTQRPDLSLLVTSGTVTAADLLSRRLPAGVIHQYAPVDAPAAVRRFLDHWRPDGAMFVESELWPNLIRAAQARGVRLVLASARMTEASAARWSRFPRSARRLLDAFAAVLPQDEAVAARLTRLGARCGPPLNLKRVGEPLPADPAELDRLRAALPGPVILAASTHPGEEALVAEACAGLPAHLVIAPRHPDRGPALAADLDGRLRSRGEAPEPGRPYIADTLGELGLLFRLADVVVMGGAFRDGIGGHNPLEPARLGRPVLTGPHAFNASDLYAEMFARACAAPAADAAALRRHLAGLLAYPHIARRMGEAALAYARAQGSPQAAAALIAPLLSP